MKGGPSPPVAAFRRPAATALLARAAGGSMVARHEVDGARWHHRVARLDQGRRNNHRGGGKPERVGGGSPMS